MTPGSGGNFKPSAPNVVRGARRPPLDSLETDCDHQRDRLDRAGQLVAGRPNGSGLVEGSCKNSVGLRLKQTGAPTGNPNASPTSPDSSTATIGTTTLE
ncbi:MAG: hypothetical protein KDA44_23525 [Planctomycetales bacterium]|nr:hypothetical protein [Planctomycetales bacterium]